VANAHKLSPAPPSIAVSYPSRCDFVCELLLAILDRVVSAFSIIFAQFFVLILTFPDFKHISKEPWVTTVSLNLISFL
jgi:hypothetical protein